MWYGYPTNNCCGNYGNEQNYWIWIIIIIFILFFVFRSEDHRDYR